jgi:beta-lactamase regulating signal transducer with metallopeptidase domain
MSITWAWAELAEVAPWLLRVTVAGTLVTAFAHVLGSTLLSRLAIARVTAWRTTVLALLIVPVLALALPGRWTLPGGVIVFRPSNRELPRRVDDPPAAVPGVVARNTPAYTRVEPATTVLQPLPIVSPVATQADVTSAARSRGALRAPYSVSVSPSSALAVLWLAVTLWFLTQLAAGIFALNFHARRAKNVTWEVLDLLPAAAKRRGRHVQVLRGGPFRVPVCWGVLSPKILLPFGSGGWTPERLRAVLLHEAAHVERRDGLFLILARVACALHWMNPLSWGILRRLSVDAEAACDSAVLRAGVPARYYATVLVDVASEARRSRRPEAAMALALLRTGTLTWRVTRILDPRATRPVRPWITASATAVLLVVTLAGATVTLVAEPTPPDVSGPDPVATNPAAHETAVAARATSDEVSDETPDPFQRLVEAIAGYASEDDDDLGSLSSRPVDVPEIAAASPEVSSEEILRTIGGIAVEIGRVATSELDLPAVQAPPEIRPIEIRSRRVPIVSGTLLEAGSEHPIQRAHVRLVDGDGEVVSGFVTDVNGTFAMRAPGPGEFHLNASALGYRETTMGVSVDDDVSVSFRIEPTPLPVGGLVVSAMTESGFFERQRMGIGRFFGPEEIASVRAVSPTDLLTTVARVRVLQEQGGSRIVMSGATGPCGPRIYVDGMLVSAEGRDLDKVLPLNALEALEVYRSAVQVPLQWAAPAPNGSSCGAIVAWTKK